MAKEYSLKVFAILLWITILLIFSLFFTHKASAQQCGFAQYSPPAVPDDDLCTPFFNALDERSGNPPCNPGVSCDNKKHIVKGDRCKLEIYAQNGTECCKNLPGPTGFYDFCDQKYNPDAIFPYSFRCCYIPPTPTPFPTPKVEGCLFVFGKDKITTLDCIPDIFQRLVNIALVFAGVVALIFVIHSGFKFVTSSGDPKKVEESRETFVYAIIGLIIVLFAFLIINIVSFVTQVNCIKFFGFICLL